jgi:hypothetical protein
MILLVAGCGGNRPTQVMTLDGGGLLDASALSDAAVLPEAAPPDDAGRDVTEAAAVDACALAQLSLYVDMTSGYFSRVHVPVTYRGAPAVFLVDTGSAATFLQEPLGSPDPVYDAGIAELGCRTLSLVGRPEAADSPSRGLPSVGTLGLDFLLNGPSEIDLAGAQLLLHDKGVPFDIATSWPEAPFDEVKGMVLPHAALDGTNVRLMLDTGSSDALWIGQQPHPGDVEVDGADAQGNIVKMYYGTAVLSVGTWQGTVPVMRVPSWPYFEQAVALLGGNIQGLLGVSAMGNAVVIDGDAKVVRLER